MGGFLDYIFASYNVWFTAPLAFVLVLAILQFVIRRLDFGGGDADIYVNADAEGDANSNSGESRFITSTLGFLNIGKVPVMIILMALFSIWGISGLVTNELLEIDGVPTFGLTPRFALGISLGVAFLCSILGTHYLAKGIAKLFPESEPALTDYDLIGLTGRVISGRVTTTFGTARVRIPNGTERTVSCRVCEAEDLPLKGDAVILVDYNPTTRIFDVTKAVNLLHS